MVGCRTSPHEPILRALLSGLFNDCSVPAGAIVDSGAHRGGESCFFATIAMQRMVHAIEPVPDNVLALNRMRAGAQGALDNLRVRLGALGAQHGKLSAAQLHTSGTMAKLAPGSTAGTGSSQDADGDSSVPVDKLDDLFDSERLGFAHLDVEGSEPDVLRGGSGVISRDQPLIAVEVHFDGAHRNLSSSVLNELASHNYNSYLVHEVCGLIPTCRNVAVPCHLGRAPALDRAVTAGAISPINYARVFGAYHAVPRLTWSERAAHANETRRLLTLLANANATTRCRR